MIRRPAPVPKGRTVPVPVVVVSTVDPILREVAVASALTELPRTAVLRIDLHPDEGELRRVISDSDGVVEDETVLMEHACMGCAVREDALPTLARMVGQRRWDRIVLLSPTTAEATPASRPLAAPDIARRLGIRLAGVLAVVDVDTVTDDIMGDDLLSDRSLAAGVDDQRSVGEALGAQLSHADLLLTVGESPAGLTLVDHLRGRGSDRSSLYDTAGVELFRSRHRAELAEARIDPRHLQPPQAADAHGVWSLDLVSDRPLHPGRFLDRIEDLGTGRLRSRGRFVLPTRRDTVCVWDGAGGQVSIGHGGGWDSVAPSTRLVFTGVDDDRSRVRETFADVLLTDAEWVAGPDRWRHTDDGLADWLGDGPG